jgi:hypothetical protein
VRHSCETVVLATCTYRRACGCSGSLALNLHSQMGAMTNWNHWENGWTGDEWRARARGRSPSANSVTVEQRSDSVPGVPRGSRLLAPIGALGGGAIAGAVLGISAGPVGLRVGAGVGAFFALVAYLAVRPRRRRVAQPSVDFVLPARDSVHTVDCRRRHPLLRFVACLAGLALTLVGAAGGVIAALLVADGRASDRMTLGMTVFSGAMVVAGVVLLWPRSNHGRAARFAPIDLHARCAVRRR